MKRCPSCQSTFPTNYTRCPRDGSPLAEAGEWTEGTLVRGKYQILAKVGQGGMAAVYKALHVRFNEPRALKVMNPELASDATFVKRFEQEAIITRRLQHPNAVRVEDIDEAEDGRPFIVMEYVEGGNLKDVIERGSPMPVARVCAIVKQVAAALDAAHALGLVHRDIKPANIALLASSDQAGCSSDRVKVLDFGIAKLMEALEDDKTHSLAHMTLTGTGMLIGTPAYMSPEQAKGLKGDQLDGRSDLYSLGVVTYQMLTGDLPLKADSTLELLMAHISTPPKPIHEARPDLRIPDSVAAVVMRCLEKNRELRPASGQALIDEIESAVGRGPVLPLEPSTSPTPQHVAPERTVELPASLTVPRQGAASHSRSWLWAVTAVLIAGALGSAWYLRQRRTPGEQEGPRVASTSTETKPAALHAGELLAPAPAQQRSASVPTGPTPGTSQAPVRGIKAPEVAPKPPDPKSTNVPKGPTPGASPEPVSSTKGPEAAPKSSEPTQVAPEAKTAPIRVDDSTTVGPTTAATSPQLALLEIRTKPPVVVSVYLDDKARGVTDSDGRLQIPGILPGQRRLRLDYLDYQRYEETVDLAAGLNTRSLTLVPGPLSGPSAATTFEVQHFPSIGRPASGRLRLSNGTLDFHGYGSRAPYTKDDFEVACSEIKEVKINPRLMGFHVKLRSRNYNFAAISDDFKQSRSDKDKSAAIVAAILAACGQR